jgi:hypothetical protein
MPQRQPFGPIHVGLPGPEHGTSGFSQSWQCILGILPGFRLLAFRRCCLAPQGCSRLEMGQPPAGHDLVPSLPRMRRPHPLLSTRPLFTATILPAIWRAKRAWASGHGRFEGQFAGILQVKIRQWVSSVCMLMPTFGEGSRRSGLARDTWHNRLLRNTACSLRRHGALRTLRMVIGQNCLEPTHHYRLFRTTWQVKQGGGF